MMEHAFLQCDPSTKQAQRARSDVDDDYGEPAITQNADKARSDDASPSMNSRSTVPLPCRKSDYRVKNIPWSRQKTVAIGTERALATCSLRCDASTLLDPNFIEEHGPANNANDKNALGSPIYLSASLFTRLTIGLNKKRLARHRLLRYLTEVLSDFDWTLETNAPC